jgi:hypothetical protein
MLLAWSLGVRGIGIVWCRHFTGQASGHGSGRGSAAAAERLLWRGRSSRELAPAASMRSTSRPGHGAHGPPWATSGTIGARPG